MKKKNLSVRALERVRRRGNFLIRLGRNSDRENVGSTDIRKNTLRQYENTPLTDIHKL